VRVPGRKANISIQVRPNTTLYGFLARLIFDITQLPIGQLMLNSKSSRSRRRLTANREYCRCAGAFLAVLLQN
jgi:hypothetical protein